MTTATAKLASKTLDAECGITDAEARRLYDTKGSTRMAIVELKTDGRFEDEADHQVVTLRLIGLELATTPESSDHLRELQRAIWRKRDPQTDIDTLIDVEPTEEQVLERGRAIMDGIAASDEGEEREAELADANA
jgi:hypothetical protein